MSLNLRPAYTQALGLKLTPEQLQKLQDYLELVWLKKDDLNLTSVQTKQEIWDRHILDGLTLLPLVLEAKAQTLADCGAGAGYIGLSLAIAAGRAGPAAPLLRVTLIDSLQKRCAFMTWAAIKLGLGNVDVKHARLGQARLGQYDIVTQRAMGQLHDILPLCLPLVKKGGRFIAYQSADNIIKTDYSARTEKIVEYKLPADVKKRQLLVFGAK